MAPFAWLVFGFMRILVGTKDILFVVGATTLVDVVGVDVDVVVVVVNVDELVVANADAKSIFAVTSDGEDGGDCLMSSSGGVLFAFGAPFNAELLANCR